MLGASQYVFAGFWFFYLAHSWDPCTNGDLTITFRLEAEQVGVNCYEGVFSQGPGGNTCRIQVDFFLELMRLSDGTILSPLPIQGIIYEYFASIPPAPPSIAQDQIYHFTIPASTFANENPGESYAVITRLQNFSSVVEWWGGACNDHDYEVLCCNITGFQTGPGGIFMTYDASTCTPCTQTLATIDYFGGFDADFSHTRTGSTTQFTFESDPLAGFPATGLTRADYYWTLTGPSGWGASGQTLDVPTAANPTPETWTINIPERCGYYTIQYVIDGKDAGGAVRCSETYTQTFCVSQFQRYACPPCGGGGIESTAEEGSSSLDLQVINPTNNRSALYLRLFSTQSIGLEMELINLAGQTCWHHDDQLSRGWTEVSIATTGLEQGIYTLVARTKNGQQVVERVLLPSKL